MYSQFGRIFQYKSTRPVCNRFQKLWKTSHQSINLVEIQFIGKVKRPKAVQKDINTQIEDREADIQIERQKDRGIDMHSQTVRQI